MTGSGRSVLLWAARILTVGLTGIVLLVLLSPDPTGLDRPLTAAEILGLILFPGGVTVGTVLAWRWHRAGSLVAIACLLTFYVYSYVVSGKLPGGPWFLVMIIPALLWLWLSVLDGGAGRQAS